MLLTFADEVSLPQGTAMKIASPFGGGMAYTDGFCGALSGALMVIGLKYGMSSANDLIAKERAYAEAQLLIDAFSAKYGSPRCTELIGYNLSIPHEYSQAKEAGIFKVKCPRFIEDLVAMLEELL